jgi:arabinan endo-1,5-alpha-L-arabinosidase
MDGGGTEVLAGNAVWAGPGGESVLHDTDGRDLIVFHAYSVETGRPRLQISTIAWVDGWPKLALARE